MDGFEVCRRLKADPATRDITVVFVTGHSDEAAETLGLSLGAMDFISKPVNPALVRARVKSQLTLRRQAELLRKFDLSAPVDALTGVRSRSCFDEHLAIE
jgi:PleD family two-component response regulator